MSHTCDNEDAHMIKSNIELWIPLTIDPSRGRFGGMTSSLGYMPKKCSYSSKFIYSSGEWTLRGTPKSSAISS